MPEKAREPFPSGNSRSIADERSKGILSLPAVPALQNGNMVADARAGHVVQRVKIPFKGNDDKDLDTDDPLDINNYVVALLAKDQIAEVNRLERHLAALDDGPSNFTGMSKAQLIAQGIRGMIVSYNSRKRIQSEERSAAIVKWLTESGADLFDEPAVKAVEYVLDKCGLTMKEMKATSSGGNSVTLIPAGKDFVIQYFKEGAFEKIKLMYEGMKKGGAALAKHVAVIREIVPSVRIAFFEKIMPLNQIFSFFGREEDKDKRSPEDLKRFVLKNANKLAWDISVAIQALLKAGVAQGDVSVENIGIKDGRFVLFDYDKAKDMTKEEANPTADNDDLYSSIAKRSGIKPEKLAPTREKIEAQLVKLAASEVTGLAQKFIDLKIDMVE